MIRDVTYCLDAEGPLTEHPHDTVMRLIREHGLSEQVTGHPQTILRDVQEGKYGPRLADVAAPHRLAFLSSWPAVEDMLDDLTTHRKDYCDSFGTPLRISWFVIDLIGYRSNPRQRAQGQHAVWDKVSPFFGEDDSVGWHVHTLSPNRDPLTYGTSWTAMLPEHEESLCRRLLDKGHFPASFRAGGCIERNDMSHWLERFIPFDYSCLPGASTHGMDWPATVPYHPDVKDYRRTGAMRRTIFPTFDADSWTGRVESIPPTLHFSFANHDRKAIRPDLDRIVQLLNRDGVQWRWKTASPAAKGPDVYITRDFRTVETMDGQIYGEPFVAVEADGHVYRVNTRQNIPGVWDIDTPARTQRMMAAITTLDGRVGVTL